MIPWLPKVGEVYVCRDSLQRTHMCDHYAVILNVSGVNPDSLDQYDRMVDVLCYQADEHHISDPTKMIDVVDIFEELVPLDDFDPRNGFYTRAPELTPEILRMMYEL